MLEASVVVAEGDLPLGTHYSMLEGSFVFVIVEISP